MKQGIVFFVICCFCLSSSAQSSSLSDEALLQVKFEEKVGSSVPSDIKFHDETGRPVVLQEYLHGQPVILIMGYYGCPMLCTLVLNGVMENLRTLDQTARIPYQVVFISIDPKETPALAAEKKNMYARGYGGHPDNWHFLTGDDGAIQSLANAIGFRYAYDPAAKQYAHPGGFVILTPGGRISRYFSGVTWSARDLGEALQVAAAEKTTESPSTLNLLCFHYAPVTGKYGKLALNSVRAGGVLTILALGALLVFRKSKPGRVP